MSSCAGLTSFSPPDQPELAKSGIIEQRLFCCQARRTSGARRGTFQGSGFERRARELNRQRQAVGPWLVRPPSHSSPGCWPARRTRRGAEGRGAHPRDPEPGGLGGRCRTRLGARRAGGHRRRDRADWRGVRIVLLQRARRERRTLHALHALRRAARGLFEVPDAARDGAVRRDLQRQRHRPLGRRHQRLPLRQERAALRYAQGPSARAQLSGGPGRLALG